jgi:hypothetical protein
MPEDQIPSDPVIQTQRIRVLKFLCVLTFIGSGMGAFAYGMIAAFYNIFISLEPKTWEPEQQDLIKLLLSGGRLFFLTSGLLYFLSVRGAFLMWQLKKVGFHFYTASQILILIAPLLFIKGFSMPAINVLLTAMFIFAYSAFLKIMR